MSNKEPVYSNRDMVKLANTFDIGLDNLVIKRYDELSEISNSISLFDISNGKRKELEDFFQNAKKPETLSPEFIFLCLKFSPRFYNFAQLVIEDGKKKKMDKYNSRIKDVFSKIFKQKTK